MERYSLKDLKKEVVKIINDQNPRKHFKKITSHNYEDVWHALKLTDYYKKTKGSGALCDELLHSVDWIVDNISIKCIDTNFENSWNVLICKDVISNYSVETDNGYYVSPLKFRCLEPVTQRFILKQFIEGNLKCTNLDELTCFPSSLTLEFLKSIILKESGELERDYKLIKLGIRIGMDITNEETIEDLFTL